MITLSIILYQYIKITIYENASQDLLINARVALNLKALKDQKLKEFIPLNSRVFIRFKYTKNFLAKPKFKQINRLGNDELILYYPYDDNRILVLKQNITPLKKLADQILINIVVINIFVIFLILFCVSLLSRMLLIPIKIINKKLSLVDEKFLNQVDEKDIPLEFLPLLKNINRLIGRINTFVLYQKELFIGIAHELKTPLAVMKTKNEVTLFKKRDSESYIKAIKNSNEAINNMNKMISQILEIGRQEGAQFEELERIDLIKYLKEIVLNFSIIAKKDDKNLKMNFKVKSLFVNIQKTLFLHIIQNFLQNAIKFANPKSDIFINCCLVDEIFIVKIINSGNLLDENIDYFAPFKRYGNKSGTGLGLFLAKSAADALSAKIYLKNKDDKLGVEAILKLPIKS